MKKFFYFIIDNREHILLALIAIIVLIANIAALIAFTVKIHSVFLTIITLVNFALEATILYCMCQNLKYD